MMGLLLGGVLFLLWMPAPALVISEETTRITGPLTADGHIDFFKALEEKIYPPELATDDNGFRIFVRTFGDVGDYSGMVEEENLEFYRLQKYEKLGLDPNAPPTLVFPKEPLTIIGDFYKEKGEEVPRRQISFDRPWTLEEYPMLADWVAEIDEPMDTIAEMIRKPVFMPPMLHNQESIETGKPQDLTSIILPDIQTCRSIARIYLARATYRIGQGNIDGAIDDKLTVHRLGRQIAQKGFLVQVLVGIAIEGMARVIPVGANPEHPLTEQQMRRILEGLDALPPQASLHDAYEWERYLGLSVMQGFIGGEQKQWLDMALEGGCCGPPAPGLGTKLWFVIASFNWTSFDLNVAYRRLNEVYDALQEPSLTTGVHLIQEQAEANVRSWKSAFQMWTPGGRGAILADFFTALLFPSADVIEGVFHRTECSENIQRLALAILLYQLEHGEMPNENWATQIGVPAKYFSCPANPSPEGMTTYALVQYGVPPGDTAAGSLMLVELTEAVPLGEAVISVDEVLARQRTGSLHPGGMNVAHRSGAVQFLSSHVEEAELLRLLGRE